MTQKTFEKQVHQIIALDTPEKIEKAIKRLYDKTEGKHQKLKEFWKDHLCM